MACDARMAIAGPFEQEIYELLARNKHVQGITFNGSERTHDTKFMDMIRSIADPGAIFLRFTPDGVMLHDECGVVYWDAKASAHLEKTAYDVYMAYQQWGCKVMLFCRPKNSADVYWQWIEDIEFEDSVRHVQQFPRPFPVDAEGWICPRSTGRYVSNDGYSGTPYKVIDLNSMMKFPA